MHIYLRIAAGLTLSILPPLSLAAGSHFVEGNKLHDWALADQRVAANTGHGFSDTYTGGAYVGYVEGVADVLSRAKLSCHPNNATVGQLAAVVLKYMDGHPEEWHKPADELIGAALSSAFPCPSD